MELLLALGVLALAFFAGMTVWLLWDRARLQRECDELMRKLEAIENGEPYSFLTDRDAFAALDARIKYCEQQIERIRFGEDGALEQAFEKQLAELQKR